jgi:hypothetical protein
VLDLSEDQVKALPKMAYEKGKWGAAPARAEKDTTTPPARTSPGAPPSGTAPKTDTPPAQKDAPMKKDEPAPKKDQ